MNKKLVITLLVVVGGVLVAGGGVLLVTKNKSDEAREELVERKFGTLGTQPTQQPRQLMEVSPTQKTATPEAEAAADKILVEGSNFKFSPTQIKVRKGQTVTILFKNVEGTHDFVIDEFDVATSQIGAGEEEEVEFTADKSGTFEYYCSVGNHKAMGMVGKLIVE